MLSLSVIICLLTATLSTQVLVENAEYTTTTVPFSIHGLHMPRLGLGTAALGGNGGYITHTALSNGVRLIDTAQAPEWYSEKEIGNGIQQFRQENPEFQSELITVVTKVHPRSFGAEKMEKSLIDSKYAIYGTEDAMLDIVLLHSPYCWAGHCSKEEESMSWQVGWRNLERSVAEGHTTAIGVSNFDISLMKDLLHISDTKISVIQNWMDPFHQDMEVREFAREHKIVYMAYSSFGTQWQGKFQDNNPVFSNSVLQSIAQKHNVTVSAVVLSWLLQLDVIAIPRASSAEHVIQNAAPIKDGLSKGSLRIFLDENDMRAIRSLDGTLGVPW